MNTIENAKEIISSYKREDGKKLRIMEVCGTHTHEIFRLGIRKLLPESVSLSQVLAVLCALLPLASSTRLVCSLLKKVRRYALSVTL